MPEGHYPSETGLEGRLAGWTKIQLSTNTRQYRSPGGITVSHSAFTKLNAKYANTIIPEEAVFEVRLDRPAGEKSSAKSSLPPGGFITNSNIGFDEPDNILNLPDAKPKPGRASGKRASARELSDAAQTTLLIVTSVISLALGIAEIQMSESEAKAIAIPFANVFESSGWNEKMGRMLASSGDYQLLGYALYLYFHRVVIGLSNESSRQTNRPKKQQTTTPGGGGVTGGISGGGVGGLQPTGTTGPVNLPYRR